MTWSQYAGILWARRSDLFLIFKFEMERRNLNSKGYLCRVLRLTPSIAIKSQHIHLKIP